MWSRLGVYVIIFSILRVETKKEVFCRPGKHERYVQQYGKCKKCDKCPPGWGYGKYREVKMDPVHGAMSCRGCVRCDPGVSFSKFIGYGPCRPCKNCSTSGLGEDRPCTTDRNARCGAPTPPPPTKQPLQNNEPDDPKRNKPNLLQSTASEDLTSFKSVFLYTVVSVVFIMSLVFTVLYVRKRRSYPTSNVDRGSTFQHTRRRNSRAIHSDATPETPLTQNNERQTPGNLKIRSGTTNGMIQKDESNLRRCHKVGVTEESNQQPIPFLGSSCEIEPKIILENDGAPVQMYMPAQQTAYFKGLESEEGAETLTDAQLMRLCPLLAANNAYRRVGRMLGIRDRDIDIIREETRGDTKESAFQTLKKWTEMKGRDATRHRLCEVFGRIERQDLIDEISNNPTS